MPTYNNILVGLDLAEDCTQILRKAADIAASFHAKLHVVHVVEPLAFAYGGDVPLDLTEAQGVMESQAAERLERIINEVGVTVASHRVCIGQAAGELHRLAEEEKMDMIIVGSHSRHGLALLFGSITKGVVQNACCDVMALKV
ncbi:universal stress protein [Teredinibacter turnerae]|uniref:universal stress protein n=1 Tax=Teredinibacter turnerae TaxID=2426 RepID=UPI00035ED276|nr:universal stress protein [Teredinibacter turnerae]